MIDTDKYEGLTIDDWYKMNHHDWKDVVNEHNDLLAEVKRLHTMEKFLIGELTNAKQVMITAVRDTLDSFSTCPSCDELTERFVDFIPEGLRDEMLLQRRDPESFWYEGDKND